MSCARMRSLVRLELPPGWRGGLRLEELSASTGIPEDRLWAHLRWGNREGVLVDLGERGWFLDARAGAGPGSVGELGARP